MWFSHVDDYEQIIQRKVKYFTLALLYAQVLLDIPIKQPVSSKRPV